MKKKNRTTWIKARSVLCVCIASLMTLSAISAGAVKQETLETNNNVQSAAEKSTPILGDVNSDGNVTLRDAIEVQKNSLSIIGISDSQKICADVDRNGKVNLLDSLYIQKYALQIPIAITGIGKAISSVGSDTVTLNKSALTLGVGESYTLIKSSPTGTNLTTAVYSSDNTSVVTVTLRGGVLSAKSVGKAVVTIKTANGATASCTVTVKKAPTSITLNRILLNLNLGESYYLDTSFPIGEGANVKYKSNNTSVASVNSSGGLVTAKKAGTAKITATTYNGKSATCTVTVTNLNLPAPITEDNIVNGMKRGTKSLSEVLGFKFSYYLSWLDNHDFDSSKPDYYIGTPYAGADCRVPNALKGKAFGHNDAVGDCKMSNTGFVWHTLYAACTYGKGDNSATNSDGYFAGLHNSKKCQYYSPTGVKIPTLDKSDGISWYEMYSQQQVKRYYYKSKDAMLQSGVLEKGDIIWQFSNRTYNGKAAENLSSSLHHVGIYYPATYKGKSVNFWHSGLDGGIDSNGWGTMSNSITQITGMTSDDNIKLYVVIKVAP
ncbi:MULTISPECIES: Ig-like domain-containing protein [unclassified Ruminococcus]|uniref:Ig-like domain-containing protein n=1 Tax=unclassified Ruminococcus TaxID=2608920 RepID=UPI00210CE0FE|nr:MULTISPECIES: Ig-like domain-containing protein [unclassified Ruminococcus]MCQ4022568.1 hypothetical protein [Ruminococcus sp. zg-924]MCQ4114808.1 hypothetical protein [Ruminococcus sp. zg-921]